MVKSKVTVESQPLIDWNTSVFNPASEAPSVCVPNVNVSLSQIVADADSLYVGLMVTEKDVVPN